MSEYPTIPPESSPSDNSGTSNLRVVPSNVIDLYAEDAKEAFNRCQRLTQYKSSMLREFLSEISRVGLIGEKRNAVIIYLAMVSRNLEQPVSVAVKGQPSSGKSNLVDTVLRFVPADDAYLNTAMSNTSLMYTNESLKHRILVIHELAGLGLEDNIGILFLRELMTRGSVSYTVTQDAEKGVGRVASKIEKEGPVSVITTTTRLNIFDDLDTRLVVVNADESEEHIKLVAMESEWAKGLSISHEWLALQQWLDLKRQINGPFRVEVPYRRAMVDLMPQAAFKQTRVIRDINHVVGLIQAHTVLHHSNREMTSDGRYLAKIDDYVIVRQLMNDVLGETLHLSVPDGLRKVVDAVEKLAPNSAMSANALQIANFISSDPKAVKRFASTAVKLGYLKGETDYRTKKLYLSRDSSCIDLPVYLDVLPHPDALRRFFR